MCSFLFPCRSGHVVVSVVCFLDVDSSPRKLHLLSCWNDINLHQVAPYTVNAGHPIPEPRDRTAPKQCQKETDGGEGSKKI